MGQERYLKGKTLLRRKYIPPQPDWDHDHCSFCWAKFKERGEPGTIQEGFVTEDNKSWICPQCFADFKAEFQWSIKDD